jgi:hypothetical protein
MHDVKAYDVERHSSNYSPLHSVEFGNQLNTPGVLLQWRVLSAIESESEWTPEHIWTLCSLLLLQDIAPRLVNSPARSLVAKLAATL